ncbi:U6 snRNA-ASSOCIATED SMALL RIBONUCLEOPROTEIN (Sm-LIKE PROTEIN) [Encephalitozoon cuniculi GB-M1]|uniref:U6 snRNA-associated Sm-like protein LSm1 n=2 Tax=Encephalitozoon cuniculi TaxID=6035 RepID=Q8SRU9_ENCCU|nr:Lsm1p-like protein [Encephalitozoon cuniculi GB-M1]AGE95495.1 U6 snRNA-associated small ribonucleoprotein [Encephalitozoon cuniculi]KMV66188.1 LSM domain-containing protein [Encephalitozoon cuniculi EcunIII-L]UYI27928.1 U6 snRNA-associated Sm-like protein LSm1 [Encephalitozoon cuniculi]CAD26651.1 U6 snRNA-ASSOCIATED SMALL RIBONUCLEOPROTEIN (Sm-LIKE PROTEIN) [Encephalitozoon cuniculi GB-M1]
MASGDFDDTRDYEKYLEQEVVVMLRDGRYLYGVMKSFDQFNSVTLDGVIERIFHDTRYAERRHELFIIRGENITMIGLSPPDVEEGLEQADFWALKNEILGL